MHLLRARLRSAARLCCPVKPAVGSHSRNDRMTPRSTLFGAAMFVTAATLDIAQGPVAAPSNRQSQYATRSVPLGPIGTTAA